MPHEQSESVPVDAILACAERFAIPLADEDNALHLKRLLEMAAQLPSHSDVSSDAAFAGRLGLLFTVYKMLDSYLRATLPEDVLTI